MAALLNAADGTSLANYEYGPFGEAIRADGALARANPLRFSTKYQDDETDLIYYGNRYYIPSWATWLGRDPIAEQGGPNLYGFVYNTPVNGIDPFGDWHWYNPYSWIYDPDVQATYAPLPLPQPVISNAGLLAQYGAGIDNDFNGKTGAQVATDVGMAVPKGLLETASWLAGAGEEKTLYEGISAAEEGGKLARLVEKCKFWKHRHHSIPKFLGGDLDQIISKKLDPAVHKELHDLLRQYLTQAGMPDAANTSAQAWRNFFAANPGAQAKAFDAVLDASRKIDAKYGTQITQDFWKNLMQGNYTAHP